MKALTFQLWKSLDTAQGALEIPAGDLAELREASRVYRHLCAPSESHPPHHGRFVDEVRLCLRVLFILIGTALTIAASPDPWGSYNAGVAAYSERDYTNALQRWEDLSLQRLPRGLRLPVWFQLGNTHFRLGEPFEASAPEEAAELWRRSCDAYRSGLLEKPRDPATQHNLALVQRRLAGLLYRLGLEAFESAEGKPVSEAIERLRDSTENLNEASTLAPDDVQIRQDQARANQRLQKTLLERAGQIEQRGDESARQNNPWSDRSAEREYRAALEDLAEIAQTPESPMPNQGTAPSSSAILKVAQEAQERVSRKLADLLTRMGQREQKEGTQLAEWNPDEALDQFGTALEHFAAAQEVQPDHAEAQRGEREVRSAMEKLHIQEGQEQLQQGKEQLTRQSPQAARSLTAALGNFEEALELRPTSVPAQRGAEEARRLLPEALAMAGQNELRAGDRAESQSATDALGHYQQAETDFEQALEMQPGQPQAQQGLQEVQPKLARLRARVVKEAEAAAKQMAQNRQPPTLQSLLGEVQEKERLPDSDRKRQRGRKDTGTRRTTQDW